LVAVDINAGSLIAVRDVSYDSNNHEVSGAMSIAEENDTRYPNNIRHEFNQVLVIKIRKINSIEEYKSDRKIIIDSGASSHCIPWEDWFKRIRNYNGTAQLGTDQEISILGFGATNLFDRVLYIPDLRIGVISTGQFDRENGYSTEFKNGRVKILGRNGKIILTGTINKNSRLYYLDHVYKKILDGEDVIPHPRISSTAILFPLVTNVKGSANRRLSSAQRNRSILDLLHLRWGHASEASIKRAIKNQAVSGARSSRL
jgi:hypothetical protein